MGKCLQDYFAVNPLEDPIVKSKLEEVHMSGQQLIEMSVKELNKRLAGCSSFVISKLKKCRRTLKNRGYAKSCRIKRIVAKSELERINARLLAELAELRQRNRSLADQVRRLLSATAATTTTTTGCSCDGGCTPSPPKLAPTIGHQQHQVHRINRYELHAADGPKQQHHLLQQQQQQQQKRQQHELFSHQHEEPAAHNTGAYHGLGHHQHQNQNQHHHHPYYHSSGSSTCNSSPVSTSSSSSLSINAAAGLDVACRSLEAELDFVLDDHHHDHHRAGCHHHAGANVQPVNATASSAIYSELPGDGWSIGGQHQAEQQTGMAEFH